jgi:putative alpha-1,2-mannosidase
MTNATKKSNVDRCVNSIKLNCKAYVNNWVSDFELLEGPELEFDMINKPNVTQ